MNSSLMELLLAIKVVAAKNRVVASPGCFLHGPPHGPPPLTKFCTPYPTRSTEVPMGSVSTRPGEGSAAYWPSVAEAGMGPH
jgi:hypothetical protein